MSPDDLVDVIDGRLFSIIDLEVWDSELTSYQAFKDPGILPRNLDPDPPYPSVAPSDGGDHIPLTRDLKVRSTV